MYKIRSLILPGHQIQGLSGAGFVRHFQNTFYYQCTTTWDYIILHFHFGIRCADLKNGPLTAGPNSCSNTEEPFG